MSAPKRDRIPPGRPVDTLPDIGLAELRTTPERFQRILESAAVLTPASMRAYLEAVGFGLRVVDQMAMLDRLRQAEAKAIEASRVAATRALPVPASRALVEVGDIGADIAARAEP